MKVVENKNIFITSFRLFLYLRYMSLKYHKHKHFDLKCYTFTICKAEMAMSFDIFFLVAAAAEFIKLGSALECYTNCATATSWLTSYSIDFISESNMKVWILCLLATSIIFVSTYPVEKWGHCLKIVLVLKISFLCHRHWGNIG